MKKSGLAVAGILLLAASAQAGYISAPPGYSVQDTVFELLPGAYPASFDVLPNGTFIVHTGQHLLEVTEDGNTRTLYSYPTPVFGSFVTVDRRRGCVFFGESSTGTISVMGLDGSDPREITAVPFNFDLELNDRGELFVSWLSAFTPGVPWTTNISMLDPESGDLDLIAQIPGVTGPVAFDKRDDLIYGTVSEIWGQQGGQQILRFTAGQVEGAVGGDYLTIADAEILADDVDSVYDIAFDTPDRICFTSTVSVPSTIWRLNPGSVDPMTWTDPTTYHYLTVLRWNRAARGFSVLVGGVMEGVISTLVRGCGRPDW